MKRRATARKPAPRPELFGPVVFRISVGPVEHELIKRAGRELLKHEKDQCPQHGLFWLIESALAHYEEVKARVFADARHANAEGFDGTSTLASGEKANHVAWLRGLMMQHLPANNTAAAGQPEEAA